MMSCFSSGHSVRGYSGLSTSSAVFPLGTRCGPPESMYLRTIRRQTFLSFAIYPRAERLQTNFFVFRPICTVLVIA